ncbi:MAG: type II toxin-antitoxin system VapC family toxin [Casimicrobiaceae bacterium]
MPAIWTLEVGNALLVAQRRGRIPALEVGKIVNALMALPVEVDSENAIARVPEWMELAQRLALTPTMPHTSNLHADVHGRWQPSTLSSELLAQSCKCLSFRDVRRRHRILVS